MRWASEVTYGRLAGKAAWGFAGGAVGVLGLALTWGSPWRWILFPVILLLGIAAGFEVWLEAHTESVRLREELTQLQHEQLQQELTARIYSQLYGYAHRVLDVAGDPSREMNADGRLQREIDTVRGTFALSLDDHRRGDFEELLRQAEADALPAPVRARQLLTHLQARMLPGLRWPLG